MVVIHSTNVNEISVAQFVCGPNESTNFTEILENADQIKSGFIVL